MPNGLFGEMPDVPEPESEPEMFYCECCNSAFEYADDLQPTYTVGYVSPDRPERSPRQMRCEDCRHECADCSRMFAELNGNNSNGDRICKACSENYSYCEDCRETIVSDDSQYHERREVTLCRSCYNSAGGGSEFIEDYSYRPPVNFHHAKNEKFLPTNLYLGIEVEAEMVSGNGMYDIAESITDSLIYCKEDGSLAEGFEAVSHPASWNYWKAHEFAWAKEMRQGGMRSYNTDTCGMHVHASRSFFTKSDEFKLRKFFRDNAGFILKISRRRVANLDRWARIEGDTVPRMIEKTYALGDQDFRYAAVNFTNHKTIEFRIFRGTLDVEGIRRNIAFVTAVCHYVKHASIADLSSATFCKWLETHGEKHLGRKCAKSLTTWIDSLFTTAGESVESESLICV